MPFDETNCDQVDERVEAWLDGELPAEEAARLERHADGCPRCADAMAWARTVRDELRSLPTYPAPPRVARPALAAARATASDNRRRLGRLRALAAAAVLVVLLATALLVSGLGREVPAPEVARAEAEVRLALALVGRVQRRTAAEVRREVLTGGVGDPLRAASEAMTAKGDER